MTEEPKEIGNRLQRMHHTEKDLEEEKPQKKNTIFFPKTHLFPTELFAQLAVF